MNFKNIFSLKHFKAKKLEDSMHREPRDLLIGLLNEIDKGDLKPTKISMVVELEGGDAITAYSKVTVRDAAFHASILLRE